MDKEKETGEAKPKRAASTKKTPVTTPEAVTETKATPVAEPVVETKTDKPVGMTLADEKAKKFTLRKPSKKVVIGSVAGVSAVVLITLSVFAVLIYGYKSDSKVVEVVSSIVPYPAMMVNNHFVSYHEYLFQLGSNKQYYTSQAGANGQAAVDFNSAEGQKQLKELKSGVVDQIKSDEVTRQLIRKEKITVTAKEQDEQYKELVKSAGGDAKLQEVLTRVYGWDTDDLKSQLKFQLLKQKLQKKITSDPKSDAQAKLKAQGILDQINAGGDFAALAKKESQDTSAADGGDLGFFGKGQMVAEFEKVAFAQEAGKVSSLVKTQYGYHIIKTLEFNADKTQVHAAHILIKPVDFENYLSEKVKAAKTKSFI